MANADRPMMHNAREHTPESHIGMHRRVKDCFLFHCVTVATPLSDDAEDAARWRWFAAHCHWGTRQSGARYWYLGHILPWTAPTVEAAIDQARAQGELQG